MKLTDNQHANLKKDQLSANLLLKADVSNIQEGKYILHKEKIDSEIELLKLNYPELKSEIISFKFLFTPNQGSKQFFESDGSIFFLLKIYTKHIKPGDMITISDVKYKETNDLNADWKNFETKLLLVYE
jgi:hypothetical protein